MKKIARLWVLLRDLKRVREVEWLGADAITWNNFLLSSTGRKLSVILANTVIFKQASAVNKTGELDHACGRAVGAREIVNLLDSLKLVDKESDTHSSEDVNESLEFIHP